MTATERAPSAGAAAAAAGTVTGMTWGEQSTAAAAAASTAGATTGMTTGEQAVLPHWLRVLRRLLIPQPSANKDFSARKL